MTPFFVANETARNALGNVAPGQVVFVYGMLAMWQWTGSAWVTVFDRR